MFGSKNEVIACLELQLSRVHQDAWRTMHEMSELQLEKSDLKAQVALYEKRTVYDFTVLLNRGGSLCFRADNFRMYPVNNTIAFWLRGQPAGIACDFHGITLKPVEEK